MHCQVHTRYYCMPFVVGGAPTTLKTRQRTRDDSSSRFSLPSTFSRFHPLSTIRMGSAAKQSRQAQAERRSNSEEEDGDPEFEMGLASDQSEDFDDENDNSSEDESDQDSEIEEQGGDDGGKTEEQGDAELEKLEYHNLRDNEQDLLKNLKHHKDEDAIKGQAVKNQKALWDKTLEFRFLLQKSFSSSNRLPQEPIRSSFRNSDKVVDEAYSDLMSSCNQTLNCMLELQEALLEKNHSIVQGNFKEPCKDDDSFNDLEENDEAWLRIHNMHCRIVPFRNSSVDKWHRKTQVTTGAAASRGKLHAFNQNISEQVAGYMRDPSRMIKRMRLRRSSVNIFGTAPQESESIKDEDGNVDGDPELLDDSEFYQQLLKEFFESSQLTSSETAFYALKKLHPKKRKVVDRRASKSRKIRYNVHEKIVNFMAPLPMVLPPMVPKLFDNLFGMGNQKATSVVEPSAIETS